MNVTVIGDAFVDIIVPVKDIEPGEAYYRKLGLYCGGTANVSIQIVKLGMDSKFVGNIGNDPFGKLFKQNLHEKGVKDLTFLDKENPTGLCISLIYNNGEKAMIANRGANDYIKKENINNCIKEILDSNIIYFSGYSLLPRKSCEAIIYTVKEIYKNKKNCEIFFNPGVPNLINENFIDFIQMFVDVLILNIYEAKTLTGKNKMRDILEHLSNITNLVVITLGKNGCIIKNGKFCKQVKTEKIVVSDTTGAGDAFAAGFIIGKLKKMNEVDCAKLGNESALMFLREKNVLLKYDSNLNPLVR